MRALVAVAEQDTYSADISRQLFTKTRTRDKRLVVWPNGDHGLGLLEGDYGARTRELILAFLRRHLPA